MPKLRIATQVRIGGDWLPEPVLFADDPAVVGALTIIANDYRTLLEHQHTPVTGVRIERVHVVSHEVIEVVATFDDDPAPASASL